MTDRKKNELNSIRENYSKRLESTQIQNTYEEEEVHQWITKCAECKGSEKYPLGEEGVFNQIIEISTSVLLRGS